MQNLIIRLNAMEENLQSAGISTKDVLTLDEAAKFMGLSKSSLYKMTCYKKIPHYKPNGKLIYFDRKELELWLRSNRVSTSLELEERANTYLMKGGKLR